MPWCLMLSSWQKFSSLATLEVVILTTSSATNDENFTTITPFLFQWYMMAYTVCCYSHVSPSIHNTCLVPWCEQGSGPLSHSWVTGVQCTHIIVLRGTYPVHPIKYAPSCDVWCFVWGTSLVLHVIPLLICFVVLHLLWGNHELWAIYWEHFQGKGQCYKMTALHCIQKKKWIRIWLTTGTSWLTLMGKLWDVCCYNFEKKNDHVLIGNQQFMARKREKIDQNLNHNRLP